MSGPTTDDEKTRESRILDGADELFTRYGYDKTTVREIADRAGVSKGTIYLHFDSKRQLFESLLIREIRRFSRQWLQCLEDDPDTETIGGLYKNMLRALHSSELIQAIYRRDPGILGSYRHLEANFFEEIYGESIHRELFDSMQEAGLVREELDTEVLAHVFDIIDYGYVSISEVKDPAESPSFDETVEVIAEMMDRALTPESQPEQGAGLRVARQLVASYSQVLGGDDQ